MVCDEQCWKYRDDWLLLSKSEQVDWIAYYKVKGDMEREAMDKAKGGGKRGRKTPPKMRTTRRR